MPHMVLGRELSAEHLSKWFMRYPWVRVTAAWLALGTVVADAPTAATLLVTDDTKRVLYQLDPLSGQMAPVSSADGFSSPTGVALGPAGEIYIVDATAAGGAGAVFRIEPITGAQAEVTSGNLFASPNFIAVGPSGEIYVTKSALGPNGGIIEVDPSSGAQTMLTTDLGIPYGITFAADGHLYVVDRLGKRIVRVLLPGGSKETISSAGSLTDPIGIAEETDSTLMVTDWGPPATIVRIHKGNGSQQVISQGGSLFIPFGVSVGDDGTVFVAERDAPCAEPVSPFGMVLRIDPGTGAQEVLACDNSLFNGGPSGIVFATSIPTQVSTSTWGRVKAIYR